MQTGSCTGRSCATRQASLSYKAAASRQREGRSSACPDHQEPINCPWYPHLPTPAEASSKSRGLPGQGPAGGVSVPYKPSGRQIQHQRPHGAVSWQRFGQGPRHGSSSQEEQNPQMGTRRPSAQKRNRLPGTLGLSLTSVKAMQTAKGRTPTSPRVSKRLLHGKEGSSVQLWCQWGYQIRM